MEVLENFKGEDYYMNDVNIYKSLIEKNDLKKLVATIIGTLDNTIENYQFFVDKDNLLHCSFNLKEPDSFDSTRYEKTTISGSSLVKSPKRFDKSDVKFNSLLSSPKYHYNMYHFR